MTRNIKMKKIKMTVALLCAMALGACVDGGESASVTAVREAKAEQLKSVAAMNNAEASAKTTLAAAEAALLQAQAEAEKANAALTQANAEIAKKQAELLELQKEALSIENKERQAKLEKQLSDLEVTKKENEAKLAEIAAQMEIQATTLQTELIRAQTELRSAQKQLAEAEDEALQTLTYDYSRAVEEWIEAQRTLASYKSELASLESGLTDLEAAKEKAIAENNNAISLKEMQIAQYQLYTNYADDFTALANRYETLKAESNRLYDNQYALYLAYDGTKVDFDETYHVLTADMLTDKFLWFMTMRDNDESSSRRPLIRSSEPMLAYSYASFPVLKNYVTLSSGLMTPSRVYSYYDEKAGFTQTKSFGDSIYADYPKLIGDIRVVENAVMEERAQFVEQRAPYAKTMDKCKALYDGTATVGMYIVRYDDVASEDETVCRNLVDSTAYLKEVYENAPDETKQDAYEAYKEMLSREVDMKDEIDSYEQYVSMFDQILDRLDLLWDMYQNYDTYKAEYQKKIDACNEAIVRVYKDKVDAWYKWMAAFSEWSAVQTELDAVKIVYEGRSGDEGVSLQVGAQELAARIETLQTEIEALKKENEDLSEIEDQEALIVYQKARVDAQEGVVKVKEQVVAWKKSELNQVTAPWV